MQTLNKFSEFYDKIVSTSSRLAKESILSDYKAEEDIKEILHFLFNPFIITGISAKKLSKSVEGKSSVELDSVSDLLKYFTKHNTGRDEDILVLKNFANNFDDKIKELIYGIIKKDITIGASEITLNKVFGKGFIPSFNVMLAEKYAENMDYVEGKRFIITEKLDGVRCMLIFNELGEPIFFSRAGKSFEDLVILREEAMSLDKSMVYDGELLLGVSDESISSADLYRMTVKVTAKDGEKRGLVFNVFDRFPKADLLNGRSDIPCEVRKSDLDKELSGLVLPHIKSLPTQYIGVSVSEIDTICDKYTDMGREGIMVNIADAAYECKRSKNLLKVKRFNAADVLVLDWEEGAGANKGKLGAVIVEFIAPDGNKYKCKVGSGFEKEEREKYYADPSKIVGHIIEIGYFELSQNQNDNGYSLRFPTFKCMRDDKTTISMH